MNHEIHIFKYTLNSRLDSLKDSSSHLHNHFCGNDSVNCVRSQHLPFFKSTKVLRLHFPFLQESALPFRSLPKVVQSYQRNHPVYFIKFSFRFHFHAPPHNLMQNLSKAINSDRFSTLVTSDVFIG